MENMNFNGFLATLNEEQRNAILSCRTEEELEQVIDDYDIEIPEEMLEAVAGGRGRLIPTLLSGIILLSGIASAPAITGYAESEIPTIVSEQMTDADTGVTLTPEDINELNAAIINSGAGLICSDLFKIMAKKYGRDLTEDLYAQGCIAVLAKRHGCSEREIIEKKYRGIEETVRKAIYPFRMNEYAHKQNWKDWVDIPDDYFHAADEGLTDEELELVAEFRLVKSKVMKPAAAFVDEIIPFMIMFYGRNLTPEVLGRESCRVWEKILVLEYHNVPDAETRKIKDLYIMSEAERIYDVRVKARSESLRSSLGTNKMYWLYDWDYVYGYLHQYK